MNIHQILTQKLQNEYKFSANRPTRDRETFLWRYEHGAKDNDAYQIFVDKQPQYNAKDNTYAYDFQGRVT